jgi:biopolymer transport protein ExbD
VRIRSHDDEAGIHIDFVPMVDVLFNLLVFFLLATSIKEAEREFRVELPAARAAGPISAAMQEIVVNVAADGRIVVGGLEIEAQALTDMIKAAVEANPEQKVSVRGDRAASYASVAQALDICKTAGVTEPFLDTVPLD